MKKHNKLFLAEADQRQRFSIRKLTIGAASVLLGTCFFLSGQNSVVKADSLNTTDHQEEQKTLNKDATQDSDQDNTPTTSSTSEDSTKSDSVKQNTKLKIAKSYSEDKIETQSAQSTDSEQKYHKISVVDDNNQPTNNPTFVPNSSVRLKFETNDAQAGDKYNIVFKQKGNGIDLTNTFKASWDTNNSDISSTDSQTEDSYAVEDTINQTTILEQYIDLKLNWNILSREEVLKDGTYPVEVEVHRIRDGKDEIVAQTIFKENIQHLSGLSWNNTDLPHKTDGQEISNKTVVPDEDYSWNIKFNFNPFFSQGYELDIPVPEGFKADIDQIKNLVTNNQNYNTQNKDLFDPSKYDAKIEQNGNVVKIVINKLNKDNLNKISANVGYGFNDTNGTDFDFTLIGKFTQQVTEKTTLKADNITATVDYGNGHKISNTITPIEVILYPKASNIATNPIGNYISGGMQPDRYTAGANPDKYTLITDINPHALNKNVYLKNTTPYDLENVTATIDIDDGMNISNWTTSPDTSKENSFTYHYVYTDGTQSDEFSNEYDANPAKKVKSIVVHFNQVKANSTLFDWSLNGVLAQHYSDGKIVSVGDTLTTKIHVNFDDSATNANHKNDGIFSDQQTVWDKAPETAVENKNTASAYGEQNLGNGHLAGTIDSGTLSIALDDFKDQNVNATYYLVLPTNTVLNNTYRITGLPEGATTSYFTADNHTVVKIQLTNVDKKKALGTITLHLDNKSILTPDQQVSRYYIYASYPKDESVYLKGQTIPSQPVQNDQNSAYYENAENVYKLTDDNWSIVANFTTYPTTQAKGNQDSELTKQGLSDDHDDAQMSFSSDIVNMGTDQALNNVTSILTFPDKEKGAQFSFQLNNKIKKPVEIFNSTTNQELNSGFTIYYSTQSGLDLTKINKDNFSTYFSSNKPEDLSKVKAVVVKFDQIPGKSIYKIQLNGIDPTLAYDAGKTAWIGNKTWADDNTDLSINIQPGQPDNGNIVSASVKVVGQSTIKIKLQYTDENGQTQYVDANSLKLTDNSDILTKAAILKTAFGKENLTNADNLDPVLRQQLIEKYPILKDYSIDFENPSDPQNSDHGEYANKAPNLTAQWNQTSQYYFDGDEVIFKLYKLQDFNYQAQVERHTDYVSTATGKEVSPTTSEELGSSNWLIQYDPLTKKYLGNDLPVNLRVITKYPQAIAGYILNPNESQLPGISNEDLNKVVNDSSVVNKLNGSDHGFDITITKDDNGYHSTVTENTDLAKNSINIIYNDLAHYIPSHANLIQVLPGRENTITVSNEAPKNDIEFSLNDNTLAIPGYDYNVYYVPETIDLSQNNVYDYISDGVEKYDSLADALAAHPTYDATIDDNLQDLQNGKYDNDGTVAGAKYNSQNFIVVYTPQHQVPQDLYILSDNDPFQNSANFKDFAIPKNIADANGQISKLKQQLQDKINDPATEDWQKEQYSQALSLVEQGNILPLFKISGKSGDLIFNSDNAVNGFTAYGYPYDTSIYTDDGQQVVVAPLIDANKLMMVPLYSRKGYYIQSATYQVKDEQGKLHQLIIKNNLNTNNLTDDDTSSTGDTSLLQILDHLTNNRSQIGDIQTSAIGKDNQNKSFNITISKDGTQVDLADVNRITLDNNIYDPSKVSSDPQPQKIILHYAPIQQGKVTIHYKDVTEIAELTDEQRQNIEGFGINLPNSVKFTSNPNDSENSNALEAPELKTSSPDLTNDQDGNLTFDNTKSDEEILKELAQQGYYVVQRDQETTGKHNYDFYASDQSSQEYNGNVGSFAMQSFSANKNYYVYLVKGQPINYQVILEDKDGNTKQKLVDSTILGYGKLNEKIATSPAEIGQSASTETINDKYQSIINSLATLYPNYSVVLKGNPNSKLKTTDEIGANDVFTNQLTTKTIYMVPKYGDVTIHYIDVDAKAQQGQTSFQPNDGEEIVDQRPASNLEYGSIYNNIVWDYGSEEYELSTDKLPDEAKTGSVNDSTKDVYVYLKHKHSKLHTDPMTVTETVHYVDDKGNKVKDDSTATMILTPQGYHDNVTDTDVITNWESSLPNSEFPALSTKVDGYDIDMSKTKASDVSDDHSEVKAVQVAVNDNQQPSDVEITIFYKQTPPTQPAQPTQQPTQPSQATKPQTSKPQTSKPQNSKPQNSKPQPTKPADKKPNKPKTPSKKPDNPTSPKKTPDKWSENFGVHDQKVWDPVHHRWIDSTSPLAQRIIHAQEITELAGMPVKGESYGSTMQNGSSANELPQTGAKQNKLGLIGLAFASVAALLGLGADRKKN